MGRLQNSYLALGISAGAPLTVALRRYRWLAQAFHPDRFVDSRKAAAEQEMRRINDARDILRAHFALKHKSAAEQCACESWFKPVQQPSGSVPKHSSQSPNKPKAAPASSASSSNQSRREKLISDARTSYRKDFERNTTEKSDEGKNTLSQEVWERRYGTYRMNRDQYADRVGPENPSANNALKADNNQALAPKETAQPIVVPQWILVVMALIFFSMAMAVNHHDSLSTQYGSQAIETQ